MSINGAIVNKIMNVCYRLHYNAAIKMNESEIYQMTWKASMKS